jgi:hypothetical protein
MGLEMLREADMVLNACGRPTPPPGAKFLDLPYVIPFQVVYDSTAEAPLPSPFASRVQNITNTLFLVRAISIRGGHINFRIKWPNGRYLNQTPSGPRGVLAGGTADIAFPHGTGANMLALKDEQPIEKGGRITVEASGAYLGTLNFQFWGVLRYLLRETGGGRSTSVGCIVGYPAAASGEVNRQNIKVDMMADPLQALEARPRYLCGPNQNIMAPEFLLGNQCTPETPAGYEDEAFTFLSDTYTLAAAGAGAVEAQSYSNAVIIPGNDDVVIRRVRGIVIWAEATTGCPCFSLRRPDGYSITGGDLIPLTQTTAGQPALFAWLPMFPLLYVKAGDRLIIDLALIDAAGGNITVVLEFDAVKRRKLLV